MNKQHIMGVTVVLVSGGVDSLAAYKLFSEKATSLVVPLYVDYHGKYTRKEVSVVRELFPNVIIAEKTFNFNEMEYGTKAFIKNRNAYFALLASNYGATIVMGGLKDDNVGDKSPKAFKAMSNLLNTINDDGCFYEVVSPFWKLEKAEVIYWYLYHGHPKEELMKTVSCYSEVSNFCGKCPACFRKFCAFLYNDLDTPRFTNLIMANGYLSEYKNDNSIRGKSIRLACKSLGINV